MGHRRGDCGRAAPVPQHKVQVTPVSADRGPTAGRTKRRVQCNHRVARAATMRTSSRIPAAPPARGGLVPAFRERARREGAGRPSRGPSERCTASRTGPSAQVLQPPPLPPQHSGPTGSRRLTTAGTFCVPGPAGQLARWGLSSLASCEPYTCVLASPLFLCGRGKASGQAPRCLGEAGVGVSHGRWGVLSVQPEYFRCPASSGNDHRCGHSHVPPALPVSWLHLATSLLGLLTDWKFAGRNGGGASSTEGHVYTRGTACCLREMARSQEGGWGAGGKRGLQRNRAGASGFLCLRCKITHSAHTSM